MKDLEKLIEENACLLDRTIVKKMELEEELANVIKDLDILQRLGIYLRRRLED